MPYTNNTPHCGNLIGSTLSADYFARYCRQIGREVLFVCGTDDFGTSTEMKAQAEKCTPREVCDKYRQQHKQLYNHLGLSFDYFGQTSTERHIQLVQDIAQHLIEKKLLVSQEAIVFQCSQCKKFRSDRFVTGVCPACQAVCRGDQCDTCQLLTHPSTLIEAVCSDCLVPLYTISKPHLFFELDDVKIDILNWLPQLNTSQFVLNASTMHWRPDETVPAKDITRDLAWGVPVPGLTDQVFYVWFDAPIGYISITAEARPDSWETWWKNPNTKLYHFIGKDNLLFHSLYFPATLSGANQHFILPHAISCTQYLMFEGKKFSKSQQVGVFADDILNSVIEPDIWRFYLASIRPETADSNFTLDGLAHSRELFRKDISNLIHRILCLVHKSSHQKMNILPLLDDQVCSLSLVDAYHANMNNLSIRKAFTIMMNIVHAINTFITKNQVWQEHKQAELQQVIIWMIVLLDLLYPFTPSLVTQAKQNFLIHFQPTETNGDNVLSLSPIQVYPSVRLHDPFCILVLDPPAPLMSKLKPVKP